MGLSPVKQPNGRIAIWSSAADDFVAIDCSREQALAILLEPETKKLMGWIAIAMQGGKEDWLSVCESWRVQHGRVFDLAEFRKQCIRGAKRNGK